MVVMAVIPAGEGSSSNTRSTRLETLGLKTKKQTKIPKTGKQMNKAAYFWWEILIISIKFANKGGGT